jgi:hypothetical protein
MPDAKIAIVINDNTLEAIAQAEETWPEQKGNRSALIRKIAADWLRNRQDNSKRASLARIEEQIAALAQRVDEVLKAHAEQTALMSQVVEALKASGMNDAQVIELLNCTAEMVADFVESHSPGK